MPKICFVIMPFGKNKEDEEFYTSVYESIIYNAANKKGYEVNRVDTKPSNVGNITKNIVNDLVYSDIVIADLSEGNANVFYELGIRHALHKCATILIIREGYEIPFDLKQHIAVFYSTDIRKIQTAIQGISNAIEKSERAQAGDSDNPVHDFVPSLSFALTSDNENTLKTEIKKLTEENKYYKEICDKYGLSLSSEMAMEADIERSLEEADQLVDQGGIGALLELQNAASDGDVTKFKAFLKTILKSKLLSKNNYIDIAKLCQQMDLIPHRIIVLKEGHKLFPNDTLIVGYLADSYSDHPQPQQKQNGRLFIEEFMNVEYDDDMPIATKYTVIDEFLLMGLLNIYNSQNDWKATISFCDSAMKLGMDENRSLFMRSKAKAHIETGDYGSAENVLLEAAKSSPNDDTYQTLLNSLYIKMGDYKKALVAQEQAIFIDPTDSSYYLDLVIDIYNRGLIHDKTGEILGPIEQKMRLAESISIINYALNLDKSPAFRSRTAELLSRRNANKEAKEVITAGKISGQSKSIELEYLLDRIKIH